MDLEPNLERALAHTREINAVVGDAAQQIGARASARLAAHRDRGRHSVTVRRANSTDWAVDLDGPAAATLEFGRSAGVDEAGRYQGPMEPLAILRGAL